MNSKTKETNEEKFKQEYKEFLENHEYSNFQQSIEWSEVKSDWKPKIIVSRNENNKIVGSILLLVRKVKFFGTIIYSSRGPVADTDDFEVLKDLTNQIKEYAKKVGAIAVLIEPAVKASNLEFRDNMIKLGFEIKDGSKNFSDQINPRFVFRLDIKNKSEEQILKEMHSKTRYNVRYAMKKNIEIYDGTKEDLKDFHKIMIETGKRDKFGIRPLAYFEKMYDKLRTRTF